MEVPKFGYTIRKLTKWNCPTLTKVQGFTMGFGKKKENNVLEYIQILNEHEDFIGFQLFPVFLASINVHLKDENMNMDEISTELNLYWKTRFDNFLSIMEK